MIRFSHNIAALKIKISLNKRTCLYLGHRPNEIEISHGVKPGKTSGKLPILRFIGLSDLGPRWATQKMYRRTG